MKFDLVAPCDQCPFSPSCFKGWLGGARAAEIADALDTHDQTFQCHKTIDYDYDEDDPAPRNRKEQHCAGAMILLEKYGKANQMMRIGERVGFYDRRKLKMDSNVFATFEDFIFHHAAEHRVTGMSTGSDEMKAAQFKGKEYRKQRAADRRSELAREARGGGPVCACGHLKGGHRKSGMCGFPRCGCLRPT